MRILAGAIAVAALLAGHPAWASNVDSTSTNPALQHEQSLINQLNEQLAHKDGPAAAALLKQIVQDEGFYLLDDTQQHAVYHLLGAISYDIKDDETAARAIKQACLSQLANVDDWNIRFWIDIRRKDYEDGVASFITIAEKWPGGLKDFEDTTVYFVSRKATELPSGKERQANLLKALFAAQWQPPNPAADNADFLWLNLLRYDLKSGDNVQAAQIAAMVTNPGVITAMRIEKQFDAFRAADPARFDIGNASAQYLAREQAKMAAHPDLLEIVNQTASHLIEMDRPAEALVLLDAALARIRQADKNKPAFSDLEDNLNWTYDARGRALLNMGRTEDAIAQFAEGARLNEDGALNVSQTINLGDVYYLEDRPKDAVALLDGFKGETSPYGRMALEEARGCAYAELNDAAGLARSMAYIEAHTADAPSVKANVQICAGDIDGAARTVIAQLADPDLMSDTLMGLQIYSKPRLVLHESNFRQLMETRRNALRGRADVQDAVSKVGRIEHLPIVDSL